MPLIPALVLTLGTLIVVVPTSDGLVILADSKTSRKTMAGAPAGRSVTEKVFALSGVPDTAFFVTGVTPVEWSTEEGLATVIDARGLVSARLSGRGGISRADFDTLAAECARIAARIHRMGESAAPLAGRDLFTVVMARAGSGAMPHEIASFVIGLTSTSAEVRRHDWASFGRETPVRVLMFGEGGFVGAGLPSWPGGSANCARQFLSAGRRPVRELDVDTAARGAYSILEATSTAMGDAGTVGPPFRAYVLRDALTELPPVAPCR